MNKVRIFLIVFVGVVFGAIAVKFQQNSVPLDQRLVSLDDTTRSQALKKFARQSDEEKEKVVDGLIENHVRAKEPRMRQFALFALRKSGFSSPKVITPMVFGLSDKNKKVQEEARTGLAEMSDAALPLLVSVAADPRVRKAVTAQLADAPPKAALLLTQALKDPAPYKAAAAANVIAGLKNPETVAAARSAVPILAELIKSTETALSVNAAFALHHLAPDDLRPVPVFLRSIKANNWDRTHGWKALRELAEIRGAGPQAVPALTRQMRTAEEGYPWDGSFKRPMIAAALEKLDPRPRTINGISWDLKHKDPAMRYRALYVLSSTPTVHPALAPALVDALDDPDPVNAGRAFMSLVNNNLYKTSPEGKRSVRKYLAVYERVNRDVAKGFPFVAGQRLGAIGAPLLPPLLEEVKTGRMKLNRAFAILKNVGPEAVPYLKALMNDRNADARLLAAVPLARLAPKTPGLAAELSESGNTGRSANVKKTLAEAREALKKSGVK